MDLSGAVGLDESPSPPTPDPSPLPQPRNRGLFFQTAEEDLEEEESPPATGEDDDGGSASGDPWTSGPSEPLDGSDHDSWTASPAGDKPAQLLSKHQLRLTARAAVKTATGVTHTVAAKSQEAQRLGLYLADEDDQKAIGDPLADIAYRRGDLVGGKLSPDANDLMRSIMGVGNYFAKQFALLGEIRRLQAGQTAEVQQFPTGEVA